MMNRRNRLNIYAVKGGRPSSYSRRCRIAAAGCFVAVIILLSKRIFLQPSTSSSSEIHDSKCRLKQAINSGEFQLFSHRSYYNAKSDDCRNALEHLKSIGVNHLDLDLVLTNNNNNNVESNSLIVAHPMEYKRTTKTYSPCGNTAFNEMMHLLKSVYNNDFFISMEPKAAWGQTQQELDDIALINPPSKILETLLKLIELNELAGHCAAIVELNYQVTDDAESRLQEELLRKITQHCQLFKGIRLSDDINNLHNIDQYDAIMPTIEFHPRHPHNKQGKVVQQELWSKSIVWVVDNEVDLEFAAELSPRGIVSNSPRDIVDILNGWCK
eukprot:scaffold7239_cov123-Skeletonema_dohrnii-CCMP3373.AAC.1